MWHIIRAALITGFRILWSFFTWIIPYSKKRDGISLKKRYKKVRKLITKVNRALRLKLVVEGQENIPHEVSCFISNHQGAADPLIYFEAFKEDNPVTFLAKKEVEQMPFVGKVFKSDLGLFLNREDLKQQLRVMMKVQDSLQRKEINWVIFPEGTRNRDNMGLLLPFHHGTFRPAMKAGVPLVPTVVYGSFRILSKKHNYKRYPTYIKFLEPIYPSEYAGKTTEEVAQIVQSQIQKELSFVARKIDHQRMVELHDKFYSVNRIH